MSEDVSALMYGRGSFAVYRGSTFGASPGRRGTTVLRLSSRADYDSIATTDVLKRWEDPEQNAWAVLVPDSSLDRKFGVGVRARWFGEPVSICSDPDLQLGMVCVGYEIDPGFADSIGMVGYQNDGWETWVPLAELEDVVRSERDRPLEIEP